jgi:hypothetical protein
MSNHDNDRFYAGIIRPARRPRRGDPVEATTTAIIAFAVGAAGALGALGVATFVVWLAQGLIGIIGYTTFLVTLTVASGFGLAISSLRSTK